MLSFNLFHKSVVKLRFILRLICVASFDVKLNKRTAVVVTRLI